jgi:protein-S-isoprenylcysteine O-methyltransferase Ste14
MPLAVPIAIQQFWLFGVLCLLFFALIVRAMLRRPKESAGRSDPRSRLGIVLQGIGIAAVGFGPARPVLSPSGAAAIAGYAAVLFFMGAAIALFGSSSSRLGKNWSFEARTLADHELVRSGPYAYVRHPIYLAMFLFLLGLAAALGHWVQLLIAVPLFLVGTRMRTSAEDRLLEERFGEQFRAYRSATPALFPKII